MNPPTDGDLGHPATTPDPTPVAAAVLIPVKALADAKLRMAPRFESNQRRLLARAMAQRVVAAATPLAAYVVCDDDEIAEWAHGCGARVIWKPGKGLNGAVTEAVADMGAADIGQVVVAHADLPFARNLAMVSGFDGITLVPDRHRDGTNVCCVKTGTSFEFAYGAGSFRSHLAAAKRAGQAVRVIDDRRLGWDIDRPDDLNAPADLAPELNEILPSPDSSASEDPA